MTESALHRYVLPDGPEVFCIQKGEATALYQEIFVRRCWLAGGIRLVPGGVVIDAGANIGLSTLFFHQECPDQRFLCYEPAPAPFAALQRNVEMHGIAATCRKVALGAEPGMAVMTYYPEITAMSGLHGDPSRDASITRTVMKNSGFKDRNIDQLVPREYKTELVEIEVRTLSDEVREAGLDRIDLLKIDVEKSELDVLAGIDQSTWELVRQVAVEVHDVDDALARVCACLDSRGFDVQTRQDPLFLGTEVYDVTAISKLRR
jgi:FkbM family methyltransferase